MAMAYATEINAGKGELARVLLGATTFDELRTPSGRLQRQIGLSSGDQVALHERGVQDLALVIAGLSYRNWRIAESLPPPVSFLWNTLLTDPAMFDGTSDGGRPAFLENPDWFLRFDPSEQALYRKLIQWFLTAADYFDKIRERALPLPTPALEREYARIMSRLEETVRQLNELYVFPDVEYAADLETRIHILVQRMDAFVRDYTEVTREGMWEVNLEPIANGDPLPEAPVTEAMRRTWQVGQRIPALINRKVRGLPPEIRLRDHQIQMLAKIRAAIQASRDFEQINEGTVIAPTGSGKTRVMVASIAMAMKEWGLDFSKGDKIIITSHRKEIASQIKEGLEELLAPHFDRTYRGDHPLKVSVVDGNGWDTSGDIILASIPSVQRNTARFESEVKASLNGEGRIPLCMMDEVHHLKGAATWQAAKKTLKALDPQTFILGFTATPTGREPNPIIKLEAFDLMLSGALPLPIIVDVNTEEHLNGLRTPGSKHFDQDQLSTRLNTYTRNFKIFKALEKYGVRQNRGLKDGLAPTLVFGVDLKHAVGMGEAYARFSATDFHSKHPMGGRQIKTVGVKGLDAKGVPIKMNGNETQTIINEYTEAIRKGDHSQGDALVAVVWGNMDDDARKIIMKEFKEGNIEVVFNCQLLNEGFDGPFIRNLVGARPSLEPMMKFQEAGRILRYGRDEVDDKGVMQKVVQRVVFDVRDILTDGGYLYTYREAYGIRTGDYVWGGKQKRRRSGEEDPPSNGDTDEAPIRPSVDWSGLREILRRFLEENYEGSIDEMALDLDMPPERLAEILEAGDIPIELSEARRLATLLYQNRSFFDRTFSDSLLSSPGFAELAGMALLKGALDLYAQNEKRRPGPTTFQVHRGFGSERITFSTNGYKTLLENRMGPFAMNDLALGLYHYFDEIYQRESVPWARDARDNIATTMDHIRGSRLGWDNSYYGVTHLRAGHIESMNPELTTRVKENGEWIYLHGALLYPNGKFNGNFKLYDAPQEITAGSAYFNVPLKWMKDENKWEVGNIGGSKKSKAKGLATGLEIAEVARRSYQQRLADIKTLEELGKLPKETGGLWKNVGDGLAREVHHLESRVQVPIGTKFWLGGAKVVAEPKRGWMIYGDLEASTELAERSRPHLYVRAELVKAESGWVIESSGGDRVPAFLKTLEKSKMASRTPLGRLGDLEHLEELVQLEKETNKMWKGSLFKIAEKLLQRKPANGDQFIFGGAYVVEDRRIQGTIRMVREIPSGDPVAHAWVHLVYQSGNLIVERDSGTRGHMLVDALNQSGLLEGNGRLTTPRRAVVEADSVGAVGVSVPAGRANAKDPRGDQGGSSGNDGSPRGSLAVKPEMIVRDIVVADSHKMEILNLLHERLQIKMDEGIEGLEPLIELIEGQLENPDAEWVNGFVVDDIRLRHNLLEYGTDIIDEWGLEEIDHLDLLTLDLARRMDYSLEDLHTLCEELGMVETNNLSALNPREKNRTRQNSLKIGTRVLPPEGVPLVLIR